MVGIRDPAAADQCSNAMCCAIMGSLVASVIGGKLVDALGVTAQVVPKP
ncbi:MULTISPECIES: hypothetical protein [Sphingomonadaceae]|jgi:hypothetical protein|nr:hypothetical protein [Sphingobium sp. GW456-12-10-14-TSB1]